MNVDLSRLNVMRYVTSRCPSTTTAMCPDCSYLYHLQAKLLTQGDLTLAAVFNIHGSGTGSYGCGDLRTEDGYLYSEAFTYAIEKVNEGTAPVNLSGLTLGALVLDSCSSALKASNLVSSVYSGALSLPQVGVISLTDGASNQRHHSDHL